MRTVMRKMTWVLLAVLCVAARPAVGGPQNVPGLKIDKSSIGGTVVNSSGREAEAGVCGHAGNKSVPAPVRPHAGTRREVALLGAVPPGGHHESLGRRHGPTGAE